MSDPKKIIPIRAESTADDGRMIVTITVAQLREIVRQEIIAASNGTDAGALLTAEDLAEKMKVPLSWVYEQSRQGNIPTHRIGKYIRFDLAGVLESQKKKES